MDDDLGAARALLAQLLLDKQIEVTNDEAKFTQLVGEMHHFLRFLPKEQSGRLLGEWLADHRHVREIYATDDALDELFRAWMLDEHPAAAGPRSVPAVDTRNEEFEAAILENPDDEDTRRVYGDWLQEHDNPLGRLIALQARAREHPTSAKRAIQKLLSDHKEFFYGRLEEYRRYFKLEWDLGFVRTVRISRARRAPVEWPVLLSLLLGLPISSFVREIDIGKIDAYGDVYGGMVAAVLQAVRPTLRSLNVDAEEQDAGDASRVATQLPALEHLSVRARRLRFDPLQHPRLRTLSLVLDAAPVELLGALAKSSLPALEALRLHLDVIGFSVSPMPARELLQARGMPSLHTLALSIQPFGATAIVQELLSGDLLPRLKELDLSDGGLDGDGATILLANRPKLAHLERLVVAKNSVPARIARELEGLAAAISRR